MSRRTRYRPRRDLVVMQNPQGGQLVVVQKKRPPRRSPETHRAIAVVKALAAQPSTNTLLIQRPDVQSLLQTLARRALSSFRIRYTYETWSYRPFRND